MLRVEGVRTFYGRIEALRGVDIEVQEGEIVTLIGANGAGKSTLLMTICGTPRAAEGRVLFDGFDISGQPTHLIMRAGIAHAPEGRRIFPRMSVLENLQIGALAAKPQHFGEDLERVFALFPALESRRDQRGGTLSGGEQQMLAIARALMSRPRLLLLDEPSLGLAPMMVKQIFRIIRDINRAMGTAIFLVEQNAFRALPPRAPRLRAGERQNRAGGHRRATAGESRSAGGLSRGRTRKASMTTGTLGIMLLFCFFGYMSGQALAENWRPAWQVALYGSLLSVGARVMALLLFGRHLRGPTEEAIELSLLALMIVGITAVAFRLTLARKVPLQYPWLYERRGLFGWREKRPEVTRDAQV